MNYILKILLSAIAVFTLSNLVPGIDIDNYTTAILVAIVLGLLNTVIKPVLIFFTIPLTIITLGLFLLFINASIVLMADYFVNGFSATGIFSAMLFSILLTLTQSVLYKLLNKEKKTH